MFTFETGNLILLTIGPAIQDAKQDAWISYVIASLIGILIVYVAYKVSLLHSNQTLIEFSKTILGKWLGSLIIISYFIHWHSVLGIILRQFADFTITILLPSTPLWALILTMLLLMIYVTYVGGVEGIARCSEVFGPIVLISTVMAIILAVPDMDVHRILPIYSDTWMLPIFNGMLRPLSFFGEAVMIMMFVSFMDQPNQGLSKALWGVALSALLASTVTFTVLTIFGPEISAKMRFPAFDAVSYISVMGFIQNIQIIAVLVYILSVFIKLSLYFFMACYGTAQWLKIKNWRKTIWVVATLSLVQALIYQNVTITDVYYFEKYWIAYVLPVNMIGIPLLLWIVGSIRKKNRPKLS